MSERPGAGPGPCVSIGLAKPGEQSPERSTFRCGIAEATKRRTKLVQEQTLRTGVDTAVTAGREAPAPPAAPFIVTGLAV